MSRIESVLFLRNWLVNPRSLLALALALSVGLAPRTASAQSTPPAASPPSTMPTASLLQTARSGGVEEGTASAFDRMLRERLDALRVVRVSGAVVLDLEQVQLAFGCIGESVACLENVTRELEVDLLLVPSLDRAGDEIVATVLKFDARDQSQVRAVRRTESDAALLEGVEPMLRELFGLPPRAASESSGGGGREMPAPAGPSLSPWPFVLMGVGAGALIGGTVAGVLSNDDAQAFRDARPDTPAQADAAHEQLSRAEAEATISTALFITGGVLIAGGAVWLLLAGNEDGTSPLAVVAPWASPDGGGVMVAGSLGGGL